MSFILRITDLRFLFLCIRYFSSYAYEKNITDLYLFVYYERKCVCFITVHIKVKKKKKKY